MCAGRLFVEEEDVSAQTCEKDKLRGSLAISHKLDWVLSKEGMRALNAHVRRVFEKGDDSELLRVSSKIWIGFLKLSIEILSEPKLVVVLVLELTYLLGLVRKHFFVFKASF